MVAPPHYKHYPRSVSWQVASVLNPSLQNSLPTSELSSHSREKREREGVKDESRKPQQQQQPPITAFKAWQQQEEEESGQRVTLPPQYVCPGELCKAMPKYIRLKVRPKSNGAGKPVAFSTATATDPVNPYSPALISPSYDLAAGSPRSPDSSGRETPRSVLDLPTKGTIGKASPASPARSLLISAKPSCERTPPINTPPNGHQIANLSPRIRSAATSPMPPISIEGYKVTSASPTLLRSKLNTLSQCPEEASRKVVMESTAQGSPLSPTIMRLRSNHVSTPPVAFGVPLPPTPCVELRLGSRQRRVRGPHLPEPTLETYKKASPNTHATNTIWNDRRDTSREQTNPSQSILIKST